MRAPFNIHKFIFEKSAIVLIFLSLLIISCEDKKIDFNTQVRPILNKSCISCHGGVKQSGGFGLVFREYAVGKTKNGNFGIVPGNPAKSEMIARINHQSPELRMPLDRDPLTEREIDILTKWIEQGAEWKNHWAYIKPKIPEIPETQLDWGENEIDKFILKKIEEHNLVPSEEADKYDLIRRVFLDITGLPPSADQIKNFVNDNSEDSFEKVVDELLKSANYGEHWASMWLDLARYADSKGYEKDSKRIIWKYRDWVIKAFNEDMPFDEFTVTQLAGDLLPNPSMGQLIATGFHRNTLNNDEGGTDNEEYRVSTVIDRVNTTWEVWQSTTMGCVQCHSHPYDPIRQAEYYKSFAFFNNTSDWDVPEEHPLLRELNEEDQVKLEEIKDWINKRSSPEESKNWEKFLLVGEPKIRAEDFDKVENVVHYNRAGQDHMEIYDGSKILVKDVKLKGVDRIYFNFKQGDHEGKLTISTDSLQENVVGESPLEKTKGFFNLPVLLDTELESSDLYFSFKGESDNYKCFIDGFLLGNELPGAKDQEYSKTYDKIGEVLNASAKNTTPIMIEKPMNFFRTTNVFDRGNWMVKKEEVSAGIPKLLNPEGKEFNNRLDMARWLVSHDNPLTARVIVNRFWAKFFGKGLVQTVEDFGALGEYPTHPELLDWLAIKTSTDWGWSIKTMMKNIVMSDTYKQTSKVSELVMQKDPDNIYLARSPRVRLTAEQVRDQALAVAGLLSDKMYGPSVMPFQPEGVWSVVYSGEEWKLSEGEDAYRRGLYTYLRRSSPYPSMITFDASEREVCLSRRINTNTPLQALVTLNDPVYMEAARKLATEIMKVDGDKKTKVEAAYSRVMGKKLEPEKSNALLKLLTDAEEYYMVNKEEAYEMAKSENIELATLTVMANALMNMDEFIVKN
ncbi:MAG: DUF1553 domain-containing protein [Cyclobacteriaceae bacterium]|jgi:hypothetical protein|nr:DUF1553 domain-containing protein [Cyclobacteriaceae bacterium]